MAKKDRFEEVKIRLVMKVRKMSRPAAVAEIARMDAERLAERKREEKDRSVGVNPSAALVSQEDMDDGLLSAEDFFRGR